jgi:hypothetical protein
MGRPSRYRLNAISHHRERARKAGREKLKRQPIPEPKAPKPPRQADERGEEARPDLS